MTLAMRRWIVTLLLGFGIMIGTAAIAWACVPQVGTLEVQATTDDFGGTTTTDVNTAESEVVVGDDDPNTKHHNSWCGDFGGHPIDAVYAGNGDEITVTVNESTVDEVNGQCPDSSSHLNDDLDDTDQAHVFVENGIGNGEEDVYDFQSDTLTTDYDYSDTGVWCFLHKDDDCDDDNVGDGVGCYKDTAEPVKQGQFTYTGGKESVTFNLEGMDNTNRNQTDDTNSEPDDTASVLCVGEDTLADKDADTEAIFAPLVVTSI